MSDFQETYLTVNETLSSFIQFLKKMPAIYASDASNAWENWIELPEMHCESGMLDVYTVLHEWATTHLKKHLDFNTLRENWLTSSAEGRDALDEWMEVNNEAYERGEDFPESLYPHLETMAILLAEDLIFAAHSEAYRINLQREEEQAEAEEYDEEQSMQREKEISSDDIIKSLVTISEGRRGISHTVTFMASSLMNCLYMKIVFVDKYTSPNLLDLIDCYYMPISPAELAFYQKVKDAELLLGELKRLSRGRVNLQENEHGSCYIDHVVHPHI